MALLISGLVIFLSFISNPTYAEDDTSSVTAKELLPLPLPTEEQLKLGRALVDKIAHVAENVPLQDSAAVLGVFGFVSLHTTIYPTYIGVEPAGNRTKSALPADLAGRGLTSIESRPWVNAKGVRTFAELHGWFNLSEACVHLNDVRARFGPASDSKIMPIFDIHPVLRPPWLHNIGHISFLSLQTPEGPVGAIGFTFEYQNCAKSFGFGYSNKLKETSQ